MSNGYAFYYHSNLILIYSSFGICAHGAKDKFRMSEEGSESELVFPDYDIFEEIPICKHYTVQSNPYDKRVYRKEYYHGVLTALKILNDDLLSILLEYLDELVIGDLFAVVDGYMGFWCLAKLIEVNYNAQTCVFHYITWGVKFNVEIPMDSVLYCRREHLEENTRLAVDKDTWRECRDMIQIVADEVEGVVQQDWNDQKLRKLNRIYHLVAGKHIEAATVYHNAIENGELAYPNRDY